MNFKKQFKKRYNEYWNEVIVSAYKGIKACGQSSSNSGFFATPAVPLTALVGTYCDGVLTIINNLSRQLPFFDDRKYAEDYLKQTRSEVICDLNKFQTYLKDPLALAKIEQTLAAVNPPAQEEKTSIGIATMDIEGTESRDGSEQFEREWKDMMDKFDEEYSLMSAFFHPSTLAASVYQEEPEKFCFFNN